MSSPSIRAARDRPGPERTRLAGVDAAKALAIFAVVMTHAGVSPRSDAYSTWDVLLCTRWVSFHVPVLLMVSGFLAYRPTALDWREVARRLVRILGPYLVVSVGIQAFGTGHYERPPFDVETAIFRIATGSSLGIFYYVFLMVMLAPLAWPLSRMGRRSVTWLAAGAFAFAVLASLDPRFALHGSTFWALRNPLNFFLAYFLVGWVVAAYGREAVAIAQRHRRALLAFCVVGIGAYGVAHYGGGLVEGVGSPLDSAAGRGVLRAVYALAVVGLVSLLTLGRSGSAGVRFLSETTYTIYLYHRLFMWQILPFVIDAPPALRIGAVAAGGIAGAALLGLLGRRWLGRASRPLLGA